MTFRSADEVVRLTGASPFQPSQCFEDRMGTRPLHLGRAALTFGLRLDPPSELLLQQVHEAPQRRHDDGLALSQRPMPDMSCAPFARPSPHAVHVERTHLAAIRAARPHASNRRLSDTPNDVPAQVADDRSLA